jgi:HEAT repeat protein
LTDRESAVRAAAAEALGRIGPEAAAATKALLAMLKDPDKSARQAAVFALGRIVPEDSAHVAMALVDVLNQPDADLRRSAVVSLALLGDRSPEVITAIGRLLGEPDQELRQQAVQALSRFGTAARSVEEFLKKTLQDDSEKSIRASAAQALFTAYGSEAKQLIPFMTERLKVEPNFEVRVLIVEELGALGADGQTALPALREARKDPQLKVREAAAAAERRIEQSLAAPPPNR